MFNNKRKRAVVLALIAFFCCATTYVAVDWKRLGGGFLAYFKHPGDPIVAAGGGGMPSNGAALAALGNGHSNGATLPSVFPASSHRHAGHVGGSGGSKPEEDLFKYGDPAAGGIPAGSFLVARNDAPVGAGNAGGAGAPGPLGGLSAPDTAVGPSGGAAEGGVTSPAPGPSGGTSDSGVIVKTPAPPPSGTPTPPPSPPSPGSPSTPTPSPAPAPTPTQSGTNDQNPGDDGSSQGPTGGDTPVPPPVPVSAVPEASDAAMMGLGALFLAVAAHRRRRA